MHARTRLLCTPLARSPAPAVFAGWLFGVSFHRSRWAGGAKRRPSATLKRRGYKLLARGNRLRPGELDLVMADGRTIVFVEVKTRRSQEDGHPAEAVAQQKQRRLTRLAVTFLKRHGLLEYAAVSTWWRSPGPRAAAGRRSSTSSTPSRRWGSGNSTREETLTGLGEGATLLGNCLRTVPCGPYDARKSQVLDHRGVRS